MDIPGRVILLNGLSSAGKSTIGRAMLPLLQGPWFLVPVDVISGLRATAYRRPLDDAAVQSVLTKARRGYHRLVAHWCRLGTT